MSQNNFFFFVFIIDFSDNPRTSISPQDILNAIVNSPSTSSTIPSTITTTTSKKDIKPFIQAPPSFEFINRFDSARLFKDSRHPAVFVKRASEVIFSPQDLLLPLEERDSRKVMELRSLLGFYSKVKTQVEEVKQWNYCTNMINLDLKKMMTDWTEEQNRVQVSSLLKKRGRPKRGTPDQVVQMKWESFFY